MDQSTNALGGSTGGTVPTDNPQNIGTQNLGAPTGSLQSQNTNLNNSSDQALLGLDGRPVQTTTATTTDSIQPNNNNHKVTFIGLYILVFVVVFVLSWRHIKSEAKR